MVMVLVAGRPAGPPPLARRARQDRLVAFDRTAAARTTVIDDQSDWFEIESNAWLDEDEREEAKRQAMEVEEAREAAAKNRATRVTLDLLGRRVDDVSSRTRRRSRTTRNTPEADSCSGRHTSRRRTSGRV